jgi:hypothetical protein
MANATLQWRTKHAGVTLKALNRTVDKMVAIAKKTKDLNGNGEAERFELAAAAKKAKASPKLLKLMETIRSGSGFYARDAVGGGNPNFSHNEFLDDYRWMKDGFRHLDKDKDGKLDVKELRGVSSKMRQAVVEYTKR